MASNPPGACCTLGVKHEGQPAGKIVKIGEYDAYVATPPADKIHKDVALLYIPDIFGIYVNAQLIVDQLAANGYTTYLLDVFEGDALALDQMGKPGFDLMKWIAKGSTGNSPHTPEHIDLIVEAAIKELKGTHGFKKIGALGYCFGAKFVARHYKNGIDVGYLAHPSYVDEEELAAITGPLSISAAETDHIFPADKRYKSEEILKKIGLPYQINLFSGVAHGFAVRTDVSKRVEKFAKEHAFLQAVAWFNEHLL